MPFVVFDNRNDQYIRKATKAGFVYTQSLQEAQVYRNKSGAVNAVGEVDTSYEGMSRKLAQKNYPGTNVLKVPEYMDIREIEVGETGRREIKFMGGQEWR